MLKWFVLCYLLSLGEGTSRQRRTVGGVSTDIREAPFTVAVIFEVALICGGVIISKEAILTAAHCVQSHPIFYQIAAGSTYYNNGSTVHSINRTVDHPKYSRWIYENMDYDISIVYVDPPFEFDDKHQPAVLDGREPLALEQFILYGWGLTPDKGFVSDTLRLVPTRKLDTDACQDIYKRSISDQQITPRMICIEARGKSSTYADSGGPAASRSGRLVGLMTGTRTSDESFLPGIIVNIYNEEILAFIKNETGLKINSP